MYYLIENKYLKALIILLVLWCQVFVVHSQTTFPLKVNEVVNHAIQNVYDIEQDEEGRIWTVTENGLNSFDGYEWKEYRHSQMSSKSGTSIQFDNKGRPWYNNFDGELCYVENEKLHKPPLPRNANITFKIENDTLWMINKSILMWYYIPTQESKNVMVLPRYRKIYFDKQNVQVYDAISSIIKIYNYEGVFLKEFQIDTDDYPSLFKYKNDWYKIKISNHSIVLYNLDLKQVGQEYKTNLKSVINNIKLVDRFLLIATNDGSIELDLENEELKFWLDGDIVLSNFKDNKGNNWIGATSGLYYYSQKKNAKVFKMPGNVYSFFKHSDCLFFVDDKGKVYEYDGRNSMIHEVFQSPLQQRIYEIVEATHPVMQYSLIKSKRTSSLNQFQYKGKVYFVMNSGVKAVTVLDDKYWCSVMSGSCDIIEMNQDISNSRWNEIFKKYQTNADVENVANLMYQVRGKAVAYNSLIEKLFFSTNQGTRLFTPEGDKELIYEGNPIYSDNIISFNHHTFILSNNGDLMYCDEDENIYLMSQLSSHLPILGILNKDEFLIFWNNQSIHFMDLRTFTRNVPIQNIPRIACPITLDNIYDVSAEDGNIVLLTGQYLLEMNHKHAAIINEPIPYFTWQEVMTNNGIVNPFESFSISSKEDDLKIAFSIMDYDHEVFDLSYRLNDGEWKQMQPSDRSIQFANIGAGSYSVSIRINGEVQEQKLIFTKLEAWYNQWWFYLLIAGFISSALIFYFRYRINVQLYESKLLLEKSDLEHNLRQSLLSSIKSQMNPHFLFNALNTIQSYIITEDKENASRYLSMYARLTRMILEMSDKEFIALDLEIKTCNLYIELERMRFPDIQYEVKVSPQVETHSSFIPSMIIQPFVENAIKHGLLHKKGEKKLEIIMDLTSDENLLIIIRDNGIGRKQSAIVNKRKNRNHQSFATQANIKRLELLNLDKNDIVWKYTDLENENNEPLGTEVLLKIPLKYNINNDTSHNRR